MDARSWMSAALVALAGAAGCVGDVEEAVDEEATIEVEAALNGFSGRLRNQATFDCLNAPIGFGGVDTRACASGDAEQQFAVNHFPSSPNDHLIKATAQNQCLFSPILTSGSPPVVSTCIGNPFDPTAAKELWRLTPHVGAPGPTHFQICGKFSGLCLQDNGGGSVSLQNPVNIPAQRWRTLSP